MQNRYGWPLFRIRIRRIRMPLCFRASWIRVLIRNLFVRIRILPSRSKKWRKTLIFTVFWLRYDFISLKNDVNVPSKRNKHKNVEKKKFCLLVSWRSLTKSARSASGSVSYKYGSEDPDPYQYVTDAGSWTLDTGMAHGNCLFFTILRSWRVGFIDVSCTVG